MMKRLLFLLLLLTSPCFAVNSISGNAGVAGATLTIFGFSTGVAAQATADGSGNYTFSGLAAGVYYIQPSIDGFTFAPYVSKQTIVASNITGVNFTATAFSPGAGIWTKQGDLQLVPPVTANGAYLAGAQGQVIYEGNAQILTGNVFKYWFMDGASLYYAESSNGLTWTRHSGAIIANRSWVTVFKNASTYYLFCADSTATNIQVYTSTDGINFTQQNASAITIGAAGTWDHNNVFQLYVCDIIAGTWYALYTGASVPGGSFENVSAGLATSPDGINWTKSVANNPVLLNTSAPTVYKRNGIYYAYTTGVTLHKSAATVGLGFVFPTDIYRIQSTDLINWSNLIPALPRTLLGEGANIINGQNGYQSLVEKDGNTYMFYMGTNSGSGASGFTPTNFITSLATAPMNLGQVILTNEGLAASPQQAIDSAQRANENPLSDGGNWVTMPVSGFGALKLASNLIQPIAINTWGLMVRTGVWPNDQYSEVTLNANSGTSNQMFILNYVRGAAGASGQNGYALQIDNVNLGTSQTVAVVKVTNGAGSTLTSFTATPIKNDIWRIQVNGTTITVYQNGVLKATTTDSTYASGSPVLQMYNNTATAQSSISGWAGGSSTAEPIPPSVYTWQVGGFLVGP